MSEDEKLKIPQIDLGDADGETGVAPVHPASVPAVDVVQTELTDEELDEQLAYEQLQRHRKQRKRKKVIRIAVAAVLAIAAAAGWIITHPAEPEQAEWQPITAVAYHGDFTTEVSSSGATEPLKLTVVTPEVDGIIRDVRFSEGEQVAEGDVLFTIKNDDLDRAVREAEKGVSSAQSVLDSAYTTQSNAYKAQDEAWAQYVNAKDAYERGIAAAEDQNELYAGTLESLENLANASMELAESAKENADAQNNVALGSAADSLNHTAEMLGQIAESMPGPSQPATKPVYEESVVNEAINSANSAVESAADALEAANDALVQAQENAAKRTVTAPTSGTIISMNAIDGASTAGQQGPLVQIADLTQMKVTVQVNEIDIRNISVGQKGTATFSALPGVELEAVVERIASSATGSGEGYGGGVVTYAVDLLIPNPDPALKPGMTATVVIKTQDVPDSIIVPVSALVDNGDGTYCVNVVVDEETWESESRTVEVIAQNSSEAAVTGDIADGDQVIMGDVGFGDDEGMNDTMAYGG